ncbi:outer membrane beta-barrel protein [Mucilaginibacter sp.]
MLKKITFAFFITIFISINFIEAQTYSLGVYGGPESRNLSYGSNSLKKLDLGFNAGALIEFQAFGNFSFQSGIDYSNQGSKKGGFVSTSNYPNTTSNDATFAKLNYLDVPLLIKFNYTFSENSQISIYTSAGGYVGYLLSANEFFLTQDQNSINASINVKSELNELNVGVEYILGFKKYFDSNNIFIQGIGKYGLVTIQKNKNRGGNYSGSAGLNFGFTFPINLSEENNGHLKPD